MVEREKKCYSKNLYRLCSFSYTFTFPTQTHIKVIIVHVVFADLYGLEIYI